MSACGMPGTGDRVLSRHGSPTDENAPSDALSRPRPDATPHRRNPILHAPRLFADYVTCRTCARCEAFEVSHFCPECGARMVGEAGLCGESGEQVELDEPMAGEDAECWEPM